MKNAITKFGVQAQFLKVQALEKTKAFLKDEKSAKQNTEEGWLVYAFIVIGIIVLSLSLPFLRDTFTDIMNFFNDGVNGRNTNPNGLGGGTNP
ncbi:hypothetical protein OSK38_26445 [Escherichia coli]|nr:hypothetical protein [Escherichia coli]